MKYYLDISLLPDTEISLGFIWQKVYQQVHLALVDNKFAENKSKVGLSFADYAFEKGAGIFPLGNKLRLFSDAESDLEKLTLASWLKRLTDYTHVSSIKEVPGVCEYACFTRQQFKTNIFRLATRRAKRKNETFSEALQHYADFSDKKTDLPFIELKSLSKNEQFKLFIKGEIIKNKKEGGFNCYGLSKEGATVPWF